MLTNRKPLITDKVGDRVRLIYMNDPYTDLRSGATGTVNFIDDMGTVFVKWDNGSALGLLAGVDRWVTITA